MPDRPFTLCSLNSEQRADILRSAQKQILYCAPGIPEQEMAVLNDLRHKLPASSIKILVDVSAKSFLAGYWGDQTPNSFLQDAGVILEAGQANRMRLGLMIVDDLAWLFVPTPQSIEAETQIGVNGLALNSTAAQLLIWSLLPTPSDKLEPPTTIQLETIADVSKAFMTVGGALPRQQRLLYELRKRLQIVQFEARGYKVSLKRIHLPSEVINIIGSSELRINERLNADWKVFLEGADSDIEKSEKKVEQGLDHLKNHHLVRLSHYGFGLLSSEAEAFDQAWQEFQNNIVEPYKQEISSKVEGMVANSKMQLFNLLYEQANKGNLKIPQEQQSLFQISSQEAIEHYLNILVDRITWPTAEKIANNILITRRFYDISEQLFRNSEFINLLQSNFGHLDEWLTFIEHPQSDNSEPQFNFLHTQD